MENPLISTVVTIKFAALWLLLAAVLLPPSLATASTLTWDPGKSTTGSDSGGSTTCTTATMSNWTTGGVDAAQELGADHFCGRGGDSELDAGGRGHLREQQSDNLNDLNALKLNYNKTGDPM